MARELRMLRLYPAIARCVLYLEYAGRVLATPLSLIAAFVALAALDVLPLLTSWLHATVVVTFLLAFAIALGFGFSKNRRPTRHDVMRRIERDSGIVHRPYDVLDDKAAGTRDSPLWRSHRDRSIATLRKLRIRWLRIPANAQQTHGWRSLAALILVIAVCLGSDKFADRLDAALSPGVFGLVPARSIGFEAWINPPDYTGLPPVVVSRDGTASDDAIEVPVGSTIEAHVTGGNARPHIAVNGKRQKFQAIERRNYQVALPLTSGTEISVTQGWRTIGTWHLSLLDTAAPVVEWVKPPAAADHAQIKLDYTAADQYGLAQLTGTIRLADEVRSTMLPKGSALDTPQAGEFTIKLSDVSGHPKSVKSSTLEDWTANPWAGFPVSVTLSATGVSGKSASAKPQPLVLPERKFNDPVARAIIAERKKLTLDPLQQRITVATKLAELAGHPELYHDDVTVFLVLRTAASRLWKDDRFAELRDIQSMLWQAATRLEDGANGEAAKQVADAAKALRQALNNGAPQSQIDKLTQDLKGAMNQYMDNLQKDLQQRMARGEQVPMMPPGMGQTLDRKDLDNMVDRMKDLSQNGNRDAANEALSQFESMMRNLRMAERMPPNSKAAQAWNAMRQLHDLADKQQQLNDKTYRRSQGDNTGSDEMQSLNNGRSSDPTRRHQNEADNNGAEQQQSLKEALQGLTQQFGKMGAQVPGGLKESQDQMGTAAGKLHKNDFGGAIPSQQQALEKLREGMQSLTDQMNKQGSGLALGSDDGKGESESEGPGKDPFGRTDGMGRATDDAQVKVPDEGEQQRSREILEELRKRDGERARPREEHDYIERLLKDY